MISEPEMADGPGDGLRGDLLSSADDPVSAGTAAAAVGRARPWIWAAGGIAAASAVWAAAVFAVGGTAPDLHGYHLGGSLCGAGILGPVEEAAGVRGFTDYGGTVSRGPALDELSCLAGTASPPNAGWVTDYSVTVDVELHKKTDPRAEFENAGRSRVSTVPGDTRYGTALVATGDTNFPSGSDVHPVQGLGDEAYLLESSVSDRSLVVLHGGAVITLRVNGYSQWSGPGNPGPESGDPSQGPDLTRLRPAMATAMGRLMASLAS